MSGTAMALVAVVAEDREKICNNYIVVVAVVE
jgi:hypothetical protein